MKANIVFSQFGMVAELRIDIVISGSDETANIAPHNLPFIDLALRS